MHIMYVPIYFSRIIPISDRIEHLFSRSSDTQTWLRIFGNFETNHSFLLQKYPNYLAFPYLLQLITPANTPATPPNFPDALTMFSNMSTSDNKMATSPLASSSSLSPRSQACMGPPTTTTRNSFSPVQTPHFPPQSNFEHQQKNQPQSGFIQPPNPWRGQTTHQSLGSGTQTPTFGINCDQNQVM